MQQEHLIDLLHLTHPIHNADFVENFVLTMQKDAEQHSNALISTDDFNTPVSTGIYRMCHNMKRV